MEITCHWYDLEPSLFLVRSILFSKVYSFSQLFLSRQLKIHYKLTNNKSKKQRVIGQKQTEVYLSTAWRQLFQENRQI